MQNVIVLGGSYAGARAAHLLAQGLGEQYRVILIDRNTHANHLYVLPRLGVLPGHEHKAFIPYKNIFNPPPSSFPPPPSSSSSTDPSDPPAPVPAPSSRHIVLHAHVTGLSPHSVTLDRAFPEHGLPTRTFPYAYAVYALGSRLPAPIDLWASVRDDDGRSRALVACDDELEAGGERRGEEGEVEAETEERYTGTKREAIAWLKRCQERIRDAGSVLCVGGGALGIQFATDIKSRYPEKHVTLLHSRHRLLPRFDYDMHTEIMKSMEDLRIDLVLGERLDLASTRAENTKINERGQRVVRTLKGREVAADLLLLCTGQTPNTDLIAEMSSGSVDPETKLAYVLPTMQLGVIPPEVFSDDDEEAVEEAGELSVGLEKLDLGADASIGHDSESDFAELDDEEQEETEQEEEQEPLPETPYPHVFVIGDAADAFGAIKAGHTAYWQAEVAARNVLRLAAAAAAEVDRRARAEGENGNDDEVGQLEPVLERYEPGPPAIKVSLGIGCKSLYQINGVIGRKDAVDADDLDAGSAWGFFGYWDVGEEGMYD
ncbi:hypothetical protein M0805_000585 [Coniferiporia weirii]|nr:hypothetical protein M0805_000585 [Coniferiporia weirii]